MSTPQDTPQTIFSLAQTAQHELEYAHREDGSQFARVKDSAPGWITDLVLDAHGSMLPDDWRYETAWHALQAIAESNEDDIDDADHEFADRVDVYNSQLLAWLGSHLSRPGYCDDAEEEFGPSDDGSIMARIQRGQYMERLEVFGAVRRSLEMVADELGES